MLPAYMTRAAIAAARYGPPAYRVAKRALSAAAFAGNMASQFRGRKKTRSGSSPPGPSVRENPKYSPGPSGRNKVSAGPKFSGGGRGSSRGRKKSRGRGARKRSKSSKGRTRRLNFIGKGATNVDETLGTIVDLNVQYLYVHDTSPAKTFVTVTEALTRKVFEKAFMRSYCSSYEKLISGQTTGLGAAKYYLQLTTFNLGSGAYVNTDINIDQNSTIDNVAAQLVTIFETSGLGDGSAKAANMIDIVRVEVLKNIYDLLGTTIVDQIILASLNMAEETVHLKVSTYTKIQNRSVGSNNSTDSADVNMTPLEGKLFDFSGIPKHKYLIQGAVPLGGGVVNDVGGNLFSKLRSLSGHIALRGADMTAAGNNGNNWEKLVIPSNFNNCKGSSKVFLAPGGIYSWRQSYSKSMLFNTYLKKIMKREQTVTAVNYVSETVGGGKMIGLQDMININTTYSITTTFEIDRKTQALLTTKGHPTWVQKYATTTVDNP